MVVVSCISIFLLNYTWSYNDMIDSLQERSHGIYSYLEEHLDDGAFSQLNTAADMQGEEYAMLKRMLENIKSTAGVRYLYTASRPRTANIFTWWTAFPRTVKISAT